MLPSAPSARWRGWLFAVGILNEWNCPSFGAAARLGRSGESGGAAVGSGLGSQADAVSAAASATSGLVVYRMRHPGRRWRKEFAAPAEGRRDTTHSVAVTAGAIPATSRASGRR